MKKTCNNCKFYLPDTSNPSIYICKNTSSPRFREHTGGNSLCASNGALWWLWWVERTSDIYEHHIKTYENGDLCGGYNIDLSAIHAHGITVAEQEVFYAPEYESWHWSQCLKEILKRRAAD